MRTKILQKIRSCLMVAAVIVVAAWGARAAAPDRADFDYINNFPNATDLGGTEASQNGAVKVVARQGADYCAEITGSGNGPRGSSITFSKPVKLVTSKAVVEFDWKPTAYNCVGGAKVEVRSGTKAGSGAVFSVFHLTNTNFGVVFSNASGDFSSVAAENKEEFAAVKDKWYRVRAELDVDNNEAQVFITGLDDPDFTFTSAKHSVEATLKDFTISNIYGLGYRNSGCGLNLNIKIDSIGVTNVYEASVETLTISSPSKGVKPGDSLAISVEVLPLNAMPKVAWSSKNGLVSYRSTSINSAYVYGVTLGVDTIIATATDGSGVLGKYPLTVLNQPVTGFTFGGRNRLNTIYTTATSGELFKLTATPTPAEADDKTFTWKVSTPSVATVTPQTTADGYHYGVVALAGSTGRDTVIVTASDPGEFSAIYPFMVDNAELTTEWYDYSSHDFVELFNQTQAGINGSFTDRGTNNFAYDVNNKYLATSHTNTPQRRQRLSLSKLVTFTQKATIEFDWRAKVETNSAGTGEVQLTFMDADAKDIFTLYHLVNVTDKFGVVAGQLACDVSFTDQRFDRTEGDAYWTSRSAATTAGAVEVTAPHETWYHFKVDVDVVNKNVKVAITNRSGAAVGAPITLPLPADFKLTDGIQSVVGAYAVNGGSVNTVNCFDNLAIKSGDSYVAGKKVTGITVKGPENPIVIFNKTVQLKAEVLPLDAEDVGCIWTSSNNAYATVDEYGVVTGKEVGLDQIVTITATAKDGSGVKGTFDLKVVWPPITDVAFGTFTAYTAEAELGSMLKVIKAVATPKEVLGKVDFTTTSGGSIFEFVSKTPGVTPDTQYVTFKIKGYGPDTIKVKATDDGTYERVVPVYAALNPYPGANFIENVDYVLSGEPANLNSGSIVVETKSPFDDVDKVLVYNMTGQSGARGARYIWPNYEVSYAKKVVTEFDWYPQATTGGTAGQGYQGLVSFFSNTDLTDSTKEVFTVYCTDKAIGVAAGPIPRPDNVNTTFSNRWVDAIVGEQYKALLNVAGDFNFGKWYHVKAEVYVDHRLAVTFASHDGTDTMHVVLPLPAGTPKKIGQLMTTTKRGITWNTRIDNIGIRNADADMIEAADIKFTQEYHTASVNATKPIQLWSDVQPRNVNNYGVTWSMAPADTAKLRVVTDAERPWRVELYGRDRGTVTLTATASNGLSRTINIVVDTIFVDSFRISGPTMVPLNRGVSMAKDSVWPVWAGNQAVRWESSNPTVASVDPVTGLVKGVSLQKDAEGNYLRDSVTITAYPLDGGSATPLQHKMYVEFVPLTRIDLYGAQRMFYGPPSANFMLKPVFLPDNASDTTIVWGTTDITVVDAQQTGEVDLQGAYGKAAVTAYSAASKLTGYYWMDVASVSPYTAFTDFENGKNSIGVDTLIMSGGSGATPALEDFQGTKAIRTAGSGSGNRGGRIFYGLTTMPEHNLSSPSRLVLRLDWFAGNTTGAEAFFSLRNNQERNLLSWIFRNSDQSIRYSTKHFNIGAGGTDVGTPDSINYLKVQGTNIWYTIEITIDTVTKTFSFIITERDNLSNTDTIVNQPFDVNAGDLHLKSFAFHARRSGGDPNMQQVVDNIGYKQVIVNYVDLTVNYDNGVANKTVPVVTGEEFSSMVDTPEREGYNFDGWYYDESYEQVYTPEDLAGSSNINLYAKWNILKFMVSFSGDSVNIPSQEVNWGELIVRPENPTRECYTFEGWLLSVGGRFDIDNTPVRDHLELKAEWKAVEGCKPGGEDKPNAVDNNFLPNLQLFPNPVTGDKITVAGLEGGETIAVVSVSGSKLLERTAVNEEETMSVGMLPQGIYLVTVTKDNLTKSLKLFVSK